MVEKGVTLSRLAELVAAYGAVADRWPMDERQGAEALLSRSPEARALVERERELDRLLAAAPDAAPSAALVARLMVARPRAAAPLSPIARGEGGFWRTLAQSIWPYGSPALPAGALAASVLVGVGFGAAMPSAVSAFGLATVATAAASETADDRLVSIALADNEYPEDWRP